MREGTSVPGTADDMRLTIVDARSGLACLEIARQQRGNSFTVACWERLAAVMTEARERGVRVLILRSAHPRIFVSGVDFDELEAMLDDRSLRVRHYRAMTRATTALAMSPFVTIAAIAGAAAGAGLSIALACDLRLAASSARFVLPPARLGVLYPRTDLCRLLRVVGEAAARELLLTAAPRDADWARAHKLVQAVYPDPDTLYSAAEAMAEDIAALSARSLAVLKEMFVRLATDDGYAASQEAKEEEKRFVAAFDDPEVRARIAAARGGK